jgi:hypothetical protein
MLSAVAGCVTDTLGDATGVPVALIETRFEKLDAATGGLSAIDRTAVKRASPNVMGAGGKIYIVGGFGEDLKIVDNVEAFDPVAGTWSTLSPWATPRFGAGFVTMPDQICASPGTLDVQLTQLSSSWDCYDMASDMWLPLTAPAGKLDSVSLGTHGGELYLLGGFDLAASTASKRAFKYDKSASAWTELAPLPAPCETLHTIPVGDTLFVLGCRTNKSATEFYAYDVLTDSWTTPPPPPGTVGLHYPNEPIPYGNGFVFFTSKEGGTVWRYDAATQQWTESGPMPVVAGMFTSALVGDKLFVRLFTEEAAAGQFQASGKYFAYDLVAGAWSLVKDTAAVPDLYMHGIAEGGSIYYAGDTTEIVLVKN